MGVGWIVVTLAVLWLLQLALAYQQAQRFMARTRALRRLGKVSIGASPRRVQGRAYVALAVGPDDRVTAAEALRGITVFANARPVPALVGLAAAELAAGAQVPGLLEHPRHVGAGGAQDGGDVVLGAVLQEIEAGGLGQEGGVSQGGHLQASSHP